MTLSDISGMYTVFPRIVSAETILFWNLKCDHYSSRECVRNLDLRVQVHPGHTAGSDNIFVQIYMDALPGVPGVS